MIREAEKTGGFEKFSSDQYLTLLVKIKCDGVR